MTRKTTERLIDALKDESLKILHEKDSEIDIVELIHGIATVAQHLLIQLGKIEPQAMLQLSGEVAEILLCTGLDKMFYEDRFYRPGRLGICLCGFPHKEHLDNRCPRREITGS
jgi:hypothetical protein